MDLNENSKLSHNGQTKAAWEWAALLKSETGITDAAALQNVLDSAGFGKIYEILER